ncbi:GNAT family N-acetyltransferase [Paenibacillus harenae]|uniref:GNAT family N-acetyltransferase n=1 Tax=Paenibacillus harenae TaxID=306543 RepID=UPI0027D774C9|nr:GNAT family N-acetyltransferase [Paenibacillus harenae]
MMEKLRLTKPTEALKDAYMEYYREWLQSGEDAVPWVVSKNPADFEGMLAWYAEREKGINLPEGWVPDSTYWLVTEQNRLLGVANLRHSLTPFLMDRGGHIGYGIRTSERRKGYAGELLRLALIEAKQLGISEVLVVCDAINTASAKTILKNGGSPDMDFIEEDGNVIKRFWIRNE